MQNPGYLTINFTQVSGIAQLCNIDHPIGIVGMLPYPSEKITEAAGAAERPEWRRLYAAGRACGTQNENDRRESNEKILHQRDEAS